MISDTDKGILDQDFHMNNGFLSIYLMIKSVKPVFIRVQDKELIL